MNSGGYLRIYKGLVALAMPKGVPHTIARLNEIKPGQAVMYYRGNFQSDTYRGAFKAPNGTTLLSCIAETAAKLEATGRAILSQRLISGPARSEHDTLQYEYIATGLCGSS